MNLDSVFIVDSTLREGEQFIGASYTSTDRLEIARALDSFGVDYIEFSSPMVSPQTAADLKTIANWGLKAKVVTHIRCVKKDVDMALDTGVRGLNMFIGVSDMIRKYSLNKSLDEVLGLAIEVIEYAKSQAPDIELRISTEDSFRTPPGDLLKIYIAFDKLNLVNRLGVADTLGGATPFEVYTLIKSLRSVTDLDIEFHGHNDTGCAIANSYNAVMAGATHIDTTVLGIGERNGITPLAGWIARLYVGHDDYIKKRYNLKELEALCRLVAGKTGFSIGHNHYIIGESAFTHKAGIHTNAIIKNSKTYEILDPDDFGMKRHIYLAHTMIGHNTLLRRSRELGLNLDKETVAEVAKRIKTLADSHKISPEIIDELLFKNAGEKEEGKKIE